MLLQLFLPIFYAVIFIYADAQENSKTVSAEKNNETVNVEENSENVSAEENKETAIANDNIETVSAEKNSKNVSVEENKETASANENTAEENSENMSAENKEVASANENSKTVSAEENKEDVSANVSDSSDSNVETYSKTVVSNGTEVIGYNGNRIEGESSSEEEIMTGGRKSNSTSIVSLRNGTEDVNTHFCAGSIISATTILTAAHCIGGKKKNHIWVVPGVEYIDDKNTQYKVQKLIIHPFFYLNRELFDVGLIILAEPLPSEMTPLELADFSLESYNDVRVQGWGRLTVDTAAGLKPRSRFLREITMRTVGKGHCERLLHFVKIIHETEMCAGSPFYDECVPESGGPVIYNYNKLVGLVSYGVHVCVRWMPDVYLQIKPFVQWIKKNMQ